MSVKGGGRGSSGGQGSEDELVAPADARYGG